MPAFDVDEGPSSEDLDRFGGDGGDDAYCPHCGTQVYHDVGQCPSCGRLIEGGVLRRPPATAFWQHRTTQLTVILIVVGLLLAGGLAALIR